METLNRRRFFKIPLKAKNNKNGVSSIHSSRHQQNLIEQHIQEMSTPLKIDIVFIDRLTKTSFISNMNRDGVTIYEQRKAIRKA